MKTTPAFTKIALMLMVLFVAMCGGGESSNEAVIPSPDDTPVTGITLNTNSTSLLVSAEQQLTATVSPVDATNQKISWLSSDASKVTVSSSGLITAAAVGTAVIIASTSDGGFVATCTVTVSTVPVAVSGVSLNKSSTSIVIGACEQLTASITPVDATNQNIIWTSTDVTRATVTSGGMVTAKAVGVTVILAESEDGAISDMCTVTVSPLPVSVTGISLNKSSTSIYVGSTEQLTVALDPPDSTNQNITWASSNASKVDVSSGGLVTAKGVGTAVIIAASADGGFIDTCNVTALPVAVTGVELNKSSTSLTIGSTEQLVATIAPANATNQNVNWSSSNTAKVTVSTTGFIIAKEAGSSVITVTTTDGGFTATCAVTVTLPPPGTNLSYLLPGGISFNMKSVPGGTFPTGTGTHTTAGSGAVDVTVSTSYWMAETEVTYELWYAVHSWAIANGYTFANPGIEGHDGASVSPGGAPPTAASQEPVTTISWRDSMIWCNALTEYYNANNGASLDLDCVYYTDAAYNNPIRVVDSLGTVFTTPGSEDNPYVKSSAKGFRLPGSMEWECAARYKDGTNWTAGNFASGATADWQNAAATSLVAWYSVNSGSHTNIVKDVANINANVLGLYDMSGNAEEWCFDWHPVYPGLRIMRGGSWAVTADGLMVGNADRRVPPDGKYSTFSFRIVRTQ